MRIGINCGHTVSGTVGSGAVGILNESDETRAVGYSLMEKLKSRGNTVVDCTDDYSSTVSENLRKICEKANAQPLDMFLSIHFNSGGGKGAEACTYGGRNVTGAGAMLNALKSLGFVDRGIKDRSGLYVLRHTIAPACLLEVCFVDTPQDADLYQKLGAEKIAEAICEAISGENSEEGEELTMSQYEELKSVINNLSEEVNRLSDSINKLENPMIYNYIDDNMPEWARPTIKKLVDKGLLKGDDNGELKLSDNMLRILVINDRVGMYGE